VLAASLMGCGDSSIGGLVGAPDRISLEVNHEDGFDGVVDSDRWELEVASCALSLNAGAPITMNAAACDGLVEAVTSAEYRAQGGNCADFINIDGSPYAPYLSVAAGDVEEKIGASDAACVGSDHGATGNVMDCTAFGSIYGLFEAAAPSGRSFNCQRYW
jgi:hypothetical protein